MIEKSVAVENDVGKRGLLNGKIAPVWKRHGLD